MLQDGYLMLLAMTSCNPTKKGAERQETMLGNQRMEMHRLIHGYHDTAMRRRGSMSCVFRATPSGNVV